MLILLNKLLNVFNILLRFFFMNFLNVIAELSILKEVILGLTTFVQPFQLLKYDFESLQHLSSSIFKFSIYDAAASIIRGHITLFTHHLSILALSEFRTNYIASFLFITFIKTQLPVSITENKFVLFMVKFREAYCHKYNKERKNPNQFAF